MRVMVTGGAGFIGSHVCETLLERGDEVFCLDNFNRYYADATGDKRFVGRKDQTLKELLPHTSFHMMYDFTTSVDITNKDSTLQAFRTVLRSGNIDAVVHLAALAGVRYSKGRKDDYMKTNVEGTMNVLDIALDYDVKRFAIASSSSVYAGNTKIPFAEDDALSPAPNNYALSKQEMEKETANMLLAKGVNDAQVALLRFFSVYGPRGRPDMAPHLLADSAYRGKPFIKKGDGTDQRDWTYVKDIANGVVASIKEPLPRAIEAFNLGNAAPVALNSLIELTERYADRRANIIPEPSDPTEMRITCANTEKAQKLLKWQAQTPLEDGLAEFHSWYQKHEL